jgi:flagellin-like protein
MSAKADRNGADGDRRAATPVVGNILLVAVVIVIAMTLVGLSFAFLDNTGTPRADAAFEYEQSPAGLEIIPQALGTDVIVKLNGNSVGTIEADSAGESVLVPTAPGDTVTIVSQDEDRSVLVEREIDERSEIGDFIAYYTFDSGSDTTLKDRSGNGNDGTINGDPEPRESSLDFDGQDDSVSVSGLDADRQVSELTVAVAYRPDTDEHQELVEHVDKQEGTNLVLELKGGSTDTYEVAYTVDKAGGSQSGEIFAGEYAAGDRHVVVGTYNGSAYDLYVDGTRADTGTDPPANISLGDLTIANDAEGLDQHFDGEIYEIRLYYTAFDEEEVKVITRAMS